MVQVANMIELGQIRAGLVVSCESARDIVDRMIEQAKQILPGLSISRSRSNPKMAGPTVGFSARSGFFPSMWRAGR